MLCRVPESTIDKTHIKALLGLAQSGRERELNRYSVFQSFGVSATAARKTFGFESIYVRSRRVAAVIEEACIREAIDSLARIQDKSILASMGYHISSSESDSESDLDVADQDLFGSLKNVMQKERPTHCRERDPHTYLLP